MKLLMTFFTLCICLFFGGTKSVAQASFKAPIHFLLSENNEGLSASEARGLHISFSSNMQTKLQAKQLKDGPFFSISTSFSVVDHQQIETLDVFELVEIKTTIRFNDRFIWPHEMEKTFQTKGKASSLRQANARALATLKTSDAYNEFLQEIKNYIDANYVDNLDNTLLRLKDLPIDGPQDCDLQLSFIDHYKMDDLPSEISNYKTDLLQRCDAKYCEIMIREAKIKVSSKVFNSRSIIQQLLLIPPTAPCADDVLEIAKTIGENDDELSDKDRTRLQSIILIQSTSDQKKWLDMHR